MIVATALLLPVLYVASFGPMCWTASHLTHRNETFDGLYWPIGWAMYDGPAWITRPLASYGELGMPAGARWHLRAQIDSDSGSIVLIGKCAF